MQIQVRNASTALCEILRRLSIQGVRRTTRAGDVLEIDEPVIIKYLNPRERIIFFEERDFPTIFVLMEAIWMMAGRNDVEWLTKFNKRMAEYSDDGATFHGSYGHRWRNAFGFDQLERVVKLLKTKPDTRRAVIQMWHCELDLNEDESGLDLPCNMLVKFQIRNNKLDITVYNRSNDVLWGTTAVNTTQFSILQEYVAAAVGIDPGYYYQVSDNLHVYADKYSRYKNLAHYAPDPHRTIPLDPYERKAIFPEKIVTDPDSFLEECEMFCVENTWESYGAAKKEVEYKNKFFSNVARPMARICREWQNTKDPLRFSTMRGHLYMMPDCDWRMSTQKWIEQRERKANAK
jgi:thymidylate synthase